MKHKSTNWNRRWYFGPGFLWMFLLSFSVDGQEPALTSFSTGGHIVYHLEPGTMNNEQVIVAASYEGQVLCYDATGNLLWSANTGEGFPFDIETGDIDQDGNDEVLVPSSDGILYAFDDDGSLLWIFQTDGPLYQAEICVQDNTPLIFTGGVNRNLYILSTTGEVTGVFALDGAVRLIESGNIKGDGTTYLAVGAARKSLQGVFYLSLFEIPSLTRVWRELMTYIPGTRSGRYFSLEVTDIDNDGFDEMIFGSDHTRPEFITVFRHDGSNYELKTSASIKHRPYKMNLVSHIQSSSLTEEFFLDLYGHMLLVKDMNGNLLRTLQAPYAFNATAFDSVNNIYYLGSELSGGDGIYCLHLDREGWQEAYNNLQPVGQMITLENNLETLEQQVNDFEPLSYQSETSKTPVFLGENWYNINNNYQPGNYENVEFASYVLYTEDYDRSSLSYGWDTKKDHRWPYNLSSEEIIQRARTFESNNQNFAVWAGHGLDPFYMQLSTLEGILKAAPNTFQAFVFPELERTDAAMTYAVETHIRPLAELCLKYGKKKILLRNKNVFWNGTVYLDLWQNLIADKTYKEIFVPAMEETDDHLQSLSLAGRTGMWMTNHFDQIAGRAVTDNANWFRLWEWGQTKRLSSQIRSMSLSRMMGSDLFHINIYTENETELIPFYKMLEKGILPKPDTGSIISMSDLAIGMKAPPDMDYLEHGSNNHVVTLYSPGEPMKVFDKLDCYWGGAPVPDYDFTRYAFNSKRRLTNFLAQAPYGNISVIPENTDLSQFSSFRNMLVTDGRYWYDEGGNARTAEEFKPVVMNALEEAASRLPIRVYGEVSWVAVRMDSSRFRLLLMDPGYLNPADVEAVVHLQGIENAVVYDILRKEELSVVNDSFNVHIPMGILRVIDIITYPIADAGDDIYLSVLPADSVVFYGSAIDDVQIDKFQWYQISGADCLLENDTTATLVVKDLAEGSYSFRLTVTDDEGITDSDDVKLTIFCESCHTPEVYAGQDRVYYLPKDTIRLYGNYTDSSKGIQFNWSKIAGGEVTLSGTNEQELILRDLTPDIFLFKFTVSNEYGLSDSDTVGIHVLPRVDTIYRNSGALIIDGIKEETWCGNMIPVEKLVKGWKKFDIQAGFMWDDTCLYLFLEAEDPYQIADSGDEWWEDDAVEVYIDADNSKETDYGENDFHFGFRLFDTRAHELVHNSDPEVNFRYLTDSQGYSLEIAIPWKTLNHTPVAGSKIGIEIRVLNDDDGWVADSRIALFGISDAEKIYPGDFGGMTLGDYCMDPVNVNLGSFVGARIWPTVTSGKVNIHASGDHQLQYRILNLSGFVLKQNLFSGFTTADLSDFTAGNYFLELSDDTQMKYFKIIKL